MPPRVELNVTLPTRLKGITDFLAQAVDAISPLPFSQEEVFKIKLALEEALSNAIRHGNKLNPDLSVRVSLMADEEKLVMEVRDEGDGFDAARVPDPTFGPNKEKPSGRGIFLMRSLMDTAEYEEGGCVIRMTKFFKRSG